METRSRRFILKAVGAATLIIGSGASLLLSRRGAHGQVGSGRSLENAQAGAGACSSPTGSDGAAPWWLIAPLAAGSKIADCIVQDFVAQDGIVNVYLRRGDKSLRIRVTKRDDSAGAPNPVARTRYYDFFLANGGKGNKPTDEGEGLALIAVAAVVEKNEAGREPLALLDVREYWRRCGA